MELDTPEASSPGSRGSWVTAPTGTYKLLATAMPGSFHNGGFEQGPFRLHVPYLPQDIRKALPEVTLSSIGTNSNCTASNRGLVSIPTPARRLSPCANPEGLGRQGPPCDLPMPAQHCTAPPCWTLRVVGPHGPPTLPLQAEPGRVMWAAWPPGARWGTLPPRPGSRGRSR
ncbi:hypothetical protein AOLI_G00187400 [Acnodon oligacanthus]